MDSSPRVVRLLTFPFDAAGRVPLREFFRKDLCTRKFTSAWNVGYAYTRDAI